MPVDLGRPPLHPSTREQLHAMRARASGRAAEASTPHVASEALLLLSGGGSAHDDEPSRGAQTLTDRAPAAARRWCALTAVGCHRAAELGMSGADCARLYESIAILREFEQHHDFDAAAAMRPSRKPARKEKRPAGGRSEPTSSALRRDDSAGLHATSLGGALAPSNSRALHAHEHRAKCGDAKAGTSFAAAARSARRRRANPCASSSTDPTLPASDLALGPSAAAARARSTRSVGTSTRDMIPLSSRKGMSTRHSLAFPALKAKKVKRLDPDPNAGPSCAPRPAKAARGLGSTPATMLPMLRGTAPREGTAPAAACELTHGACASPPRRAEPSPAPLTPTSGNATPSPKRTPLADKPHSVAQRVDPAQYVVRVGDTERDASFVPGADFATLQRLASTGGAALKGHALPVAACARGDLDQALPVVLVEPVSCDDLAAEACQPPIRRPTTATMIPDQMAMPGSRMPRIPFPAVAGTII